MADFYIDTLRQLLARGVLRRDMKVLVVCAGEYDRRVLLECGFTDVTLSNLDAPPVYSGIITIQGESVAPFAWSFQDAERLKFDDGEFDVVLAHSGLHHAQSPHRVLLEMYRVARTGIVVFEPVDNPVTRLGVRLGLGQEYEVAAVAATGCRFGGQRNTPIPNYVYRWTRREVEKTVLSFAPVGKHRFLYFYALRFPWFRSRMLTRRILDTVFLALTPAAWCATRLFPRLSNNFAFVVLKPNLPDDLHPWLTAEGGRIAPNASWLATRYRPPAPAGGKLPPRQAAPMVSKPL
jgi:ubiquinone/menaquinone biosynthesis C-methylase UbiE